MAYKYQLGSARLSGSTTYEENLTGLANISSSVQLQGGSLQLNDGNNISSTGVAQMFSYQLGDGTEVISSGAAVSGSNILGTIGRIADLHFQAGGNLRATDGTVKLGDNDLTSTGDVKVNDLSGSGTLIVDGTSALNGAVTVKNGVAFNSNTVNIDGGAIDGTTIGAAAQSSVKATTLSGSSTLNVDGISTLNGAVTVKSGVAFTANAVDINGGAIDGAIIGAAAAAAATFTSVSASVNISGSGFYGSGAGLTDISSDKIDTTAVGATNASHYVTFANAATSQDGTDLYVNGALDLRPQSGSLLLSGSTEHLEIEDMGGGFYLTESYGSKLSLYGNKITEANATNIWSGWGALPATGLNYGTTRIAGASQGGMSNIEISGSSLTLDFASKDALAGLAGGVNIETNTLDILLSQTGAVDEGSERPLWKVGTDDDNYLLLRPHNEFDGKGWIWPRVQGNIENFNAGQLTASFGPLTVNSSDNAAAAGLTINGNSANKQYALQVNQGSASFNAGVEINGATAHGPGLVVHANGMSVNAGIARFLGGLTASAGLTVQGGAGALFTGPVTLGDASADAISVNGTPTFNADVTVSNGNAFTANGNVTLGNASSDGVTWNAGTLNATANNVFATIKDGVSGIDTAGPFCFSTGSGGDFLGFHTAGSNKGVVLHRNVYMNGVGDGELQPAANLSLYVSSAVNGYVTRTSGQQMFSQAAGDALSATNGVLNVGHSTGIDISGGGNLVISSSALADVGSDIGVGFADNGLMFFNTSDATAKRASFAKLAESMAGTGLTASNGQLVLSAAGTVNPLSPHANATMVEGTNYVTGAALTQNVVYATPLKSSVNVGDRVRFKAIGNLGAFTIQLSGSEDQTIDFDNTIEIESPHGAVELYYVSVGNWRVF